MNVLGAGLLTLLYGAVFYWEWGSCQGKSRWEKGAFTVLFAAIYLCSILVLVIPEIPGPTQWVTPLLKPLGSILEK